MRREEPDARGVEWLGYLDRTRRQKRTGRWYAAVVIWLRLMPLVCPEQSFKKAKEKTLISPRLDLGTLCVLDTCDNHLHHETVLTAHLGPIQTKIILSNLVIDFDSIKVQRRKRNKKKSPPLAIRSEYYTPPPESTTTDYSLYSFSSAARANVFQWRLTLPGSFSVPFLLLRSLVHSTHLPLSTIESKMYEHSSRVIAVDVFAGEGAACASGDGEEPEPPAPRASSVVLTAFAGEAWLALG